jgi:hypothetical protein
VTVPIWLSLISEALAMPRSIAEAMIAGLVQKLSSPTSSTWPPSRLVSSIQPSSSSSPSPRRRPGRHRPGDPRGARGLVPKGVRHRDRPQRRPPRQLQQKRHALATRMQAREADYLRYARDLRIPFTDNEAERAIRMSKLRIKISGCMRSMTGAEEFCAIRSYLATAARHGITGLDALTRAFQGNPWIPETG